MGGAPSEPDRDRGEEIVLRVDDRGRVTLPKEIRERLGIDRNDRLRATVVGSVLEIDPKPSTKLETATAGREDWAGSTPTDAGEALFGPMEDEDPSA